MNALPLKRKSNEPQLIDCGPHGVLTYRQIAAIAGVSVCAIRNRASKGATGDALVRPFKPAGRPKGSYRDQIPGLNQCQSMEIAFKFARVFRDRVPTAAEVSEKFGMSKCNAYRWIAAWKAANGIA